MSNSSDFWTASWAALTAWLFIPRFEQNRLWTFHLRFIFSATNKNEKWKNIYNHVHYIRHFLVRQKMFANLLFTSERSSKEILTIKSPACIVPISTDWPFSNPSCFTMYSFARPISFFVAPLATEQISIPNPHVQGSSYTKERKFRKHPDVKRIISCTLYGSRLVFLSTSNI